MHILIVDDEIYIRELVAKYLKHEQYETSFACNGLEAIELVKQSGSHRDPCTHGAPPPALYPAVGKWCR